MESIKNTFFHKFEIECFDKQGKLKWSDVNYNLITNEGLDNILDIYWGAVAKNANYFVGLIDAASFTAIAAADVMNSHTGWLELSEYDEATREALTIVAAATQSVTNAASKAVFTINATKTIKGAFLTTNNVIDGTTGLLIGAVVFSGGDKVAASGDTLNVTVTLSSASA